jgi:hypothetical protein
MDTVATRSAMDERRELAAKRRLVEIVHVPKSQIPYRVLKRSTGVCLLNAQREQEVSDFLDKVSLESLRVKPKRRLSR